MKQKGQKKGEKGRRGEVRSSDLCHCSSAELVVRDSQGNCCWVAGGEKMHSLGFSPKHATTGIWSSGRMRCRWRQPHQSRAREGAGSSSCPFLLDRAPDVCFPVMVRKPKPPSSHGYWAVEQNPLPTQEEARSVRSNEVSDRAPYR